MDNEEFIKLKVTATLDDGYEIEETIKIYKKYWDEACRYSGNSYKDDLVAMHIMDRLNFEYEVVDES